MSRIDVDVALEIATHESIIRQAYRDSKNIWTWSVGLTSASGHNVERYIGKPQSLEHCLKIYVWALQRYAADVLEAFGSHKLTKAEFAAALSFHWNTGGIKKAKWVRMVKEGNRIGASKAILNWRNPPEILGRRKKERDLFFDGTWSNDGRMTEYTLLTSRSTPDWGSGKRINVASALRAALGQETKPPVVEPPALEPPSTTPPDPVKPKPATGWGAFWTVVAAIFNGVFRRQHP